MTPPKWYEEIFISAGLSPFKWGLSFVIEPWWHQAHLTIGPLWIAVGWPSFQPQP